VKKKIAVILAIVATLPTGAASMGCIFCLVDEPKYPKFLID